MVFKDKILPVLRIIPVKEDEVLVTQFPVEISERDLQDKVVEFGCCR